MKPLATDCVHKSEEPRFIGGIEQAAGANVSTSTGHGKDETGEGRCRTRRPIGRKSSLHVDGAERYHKKDSQKVKSIDRMWKRRTELMEEKNALLLYGRDKCFTERDLRERGKFFRLLLERALQTH